MQNLRVEIKLDSSSVADSLASSINTILSGYTLNDAVPFNNVARTCDLNTTESGVYSVCLSADFNSIRDRHDALELIQNAVAGVQANVTSALYWKHLCHADSAPVICSEVSA